MDNNEEIYRLVGQLVVDSHFTTSQLQRQLKDALIEINQLKEMIVQTKGKADGSE